jgi:hypothetical protein
MGDSKGYATSEGRPEARGLAQIMHVFSAQMIDCEDDFLDSIPAWQQQQRSFTEWVRRV